ncbi:hypothetical protein NUKP65_32630 [Klebsiella variicola]|nr:hypothetical protein NUKP65_32630 [Klebsiella variicola]GKM80562.1 hypothetical protein NUKP68_34290 [Klebsiella variicola]
MGLSARAYFTDHADDLFQRGTMKNIILCDVTASVSELKNDPVATASAGGGYPVAIIDRNRHVFLLCARSSV